MKNVYGLITSLLISLNSLAQVEDSSVIKVRAYNVLKGLKEYPNTYAHQEGVSRKYIDSLRYYSKKEDYFTYAHDSSVVIRYIGFMSLMIEDDEHAYQVLQEYIRDTTILWYNVCTLEPYEYRNEIVRDYINYINSVYKEGNGGCNVCLYCYMSAGKNVELYQFKRNRLDAFFKQEGIIIPVYFTMSDSELNGTKREQRRVKRVMKKA